VNEYRKYVLLVHLAVIKGHDEIVAFLVANGADLNAQDANGNNAVIYKIL
jgi:ankyrin repeat protein